MKLFFPIFTSFLLLLLIGCSDEPNAVGIGLLSPDDSLSLNTVGLTATTSSTYLARIAGVSARQLFGKSSDIETRAIIQFAGIPYGLSSFTIDTAVLRVAITYRYKDSSGTLGLDVKRLLRSWSKDSIRWDSTNVPSFVNASNDTSFTRAITPSDSIIEFPIAPVLRTWMQDSLASPYGMILIPNGASNIIIGCSTVYDIFFDGRPQLYLVYHTATDTIRATYRPFQQIFLAETPLVTTPDTLMVVQAGVSHRGRLQFDLSGIPNRASITQASLVLTLDSTQSLRNSYSTNTIVAHIASGIDSLSSLTASATLTGDSQKTATLDVRPLVQQIVSRRPYYNFVIRSSSEFIAVDRYAFYSATSSDSTRMPRLNITYTILP
ncbi:MAG: DNRLRE domain-containing protein [Bacteroidetes bacterium]|nr:MAG: DNRLRE domain-containing protein [Bacteroidota bacterium]